jgi:hypothetical protein
MERKPKSFKNATQSTSKESSLEAPHNADSHNTGSSQKQPILEYGSYHF